MAVIRPPAPVVAVPVDWVLDDRIGPFAFRLLVLLHDEALPATIEDGEVARLLSYTPGALTSAYRSLADAGYLVAHIGGGWAVTR